jgi:Domain of unknown function (DUF397)
MRYHARRALLMQEPMHVQMSRPHTLKGNERVLDRRGGSDQAEPRVARLGLVRELDRENPMRQTPNGIPAHQLSGAHWQKSGRSNPSGNCVELAQLPHGEIAMRNSRDPDGPALIYTREEIVAFILGARDGDFDNFVL